MSFQITPGRSRTTSSRRPSAAVALGLRKSTSSPSKVTKSTPTPRRQSSTPSQPQETYDEPLDDTGIPANLASNLHFRDIPQCITHIRTHQFSPIPEKGPGMNSTRIAEVLNYRRNLPPIVTIAHVDALSTSSTRTEREINELARDGVVRKVSIPQRGVGSSAVGDGIVLVGEWVERVRQSASVEEELKEKYIGLMEKNPTSSSIPGSLFSPQELSTLTQSGFLTTPTTTTSQSTSLFSLPPSSSSGIGTGGTGSSLIKAGSRNASGSLAAIGGTEAAHISNPSLLTRNSTNSTPFSSTVTYNFSLPNTGSHIKLISEPRSHLLLLLKRLSPRHKEAPLTILKERWDGSVSSGNKSVEKDPLSGELKFGVLAGRTKKWKSFWGLRFEWVLEECVGAGLVECFETESVGVGVRVV